jgi:hypothetical protein
MTWQATAAFLACARIGAVHSAVFAGFSAESLRDRVKDCDCKVVITTEYVPLKTEIGWVLMIVREREVERLLLLKLVRLPFFCSFHCISNTSPLHLQSTIHVPPIPIPCSMRSSWTSLDLPSRALGRSLRSQPR